MVLESARVDYCWIFCGFDSQVLALRSDFPMLGSRFMFFSIDGSPISCFTKPHNLLSLVLMNHLHVFPLIYVIFWNISFFFGKDISILSDSPPEPGLSFSQRRRSPDLRCGVGCAATRRGEPRWDSDHIGIIGSGAVVNQKRGWNQRKAVDFAVKNQKT